MRTDAQSPVPLAPVDDCGDTGSSTYSARQLDHSRCFAPVRSSVMSELAPSCSQRRLGPTSLGPDSLWDSHDGPFSEDSRGAVTVDLKAMSRRRTTSTSPSSLITLDLTSLQPRAELEPENSASAGLGRPQHAQRQAKRIRSNEILCQPVPKRGAGFLS